MAGWPNTIVENFVALAKDTPAKAAHIFWKRLVLSYSVIVQDLAVQTFALSRSVSAPLAKTALRSNFAMTCAVGIDIALTSSDAPGEINSPVQNVFFPCIAVEYWRHTALSYTPMCR